MEYVSQYSMTLPTLDAVTYSWLLQVDQFLQF